MSISAEQAAEAFGIGRVEGLAHSLELESVRMTAILERMGNLHPEYLNLAEIAVRLERYASEVRYAAGVIREIG